VTPVPNCTTTGPAMTLKPLDAAFGIRSVIMTSDRRRRRGACVLVSHNTKMGAARGAILVAEYLVHRGHV
jgi:aspartate-semialdehyde dehydrogenase